MIKTIKSRVHTVPCGSVFCKIILKLFLLTTYRYTWLRINVFLTLAQPQINLTLRIGKSRASRSVPRGYLAGVRKQISRGVICLFGPRSQCEQGKRFFTHRAPVIGSSRAPADQSRTWSTCRRCGVVNEFDEFQNNDLFSLGSTVILQCAFIGSSKLHVKI